MKIAELLLMQGANANIRDKGGYCPIDYAAMNQDLGMIQVLPNYLGFYTPFKYTFNSV